MEMDSGFDKQVLKQMIERKRQNDFIRKREFDQLRKIRSRGVSAVVGAGRPSVFQSSIATDQDGRAVTLKKIDEIEAQMSKQWWKGKQDAAAAQETGFPVAKAVAETPARAIVSPPLSVSEQFGHTESADFLMEPAAPVEVTGAGEFMATEMGSGMEPAVPSSPAKGRASPGTATTLGALAQSYDGAELGFSTSKLFAIDVEDMATDPELEEAAIRFANGDDEGAEAGLLEALRGQSVGDDVANSWIAALLDLYRATHNRVRFDQVVAEFPQRFETVSPQWAAIGEEPSNDHAPAPAAAPVDTRDYSVGAIWSSPADLTAQDMEDLRDAMASNATPWHLDWSRIVRIADDAMPLMAGLFSSLCNEPVALRFSGAARLVETLRTMMPSGDRSISQDWWAMRLNALRTLQLLDEFELAALDFCVTYEVSPPAWQEARCEYANVEDEGKSVVDTSPASMGAGSTFGQTITAPIGMDNTNTVKLELKGSVLGDATQALSDFAATGHGGAGIIVSCRGLTRVDFSAAGSILNWVAMREAEGCHVQFRDVHRLVAAFFNVIGITEHARVVPRPV